MSSIMHLGTSEAAKFIFEFLIYDIQFAKSRNFLIKKPLDTPRCGNRFPGVASSPLSLLERDFKLLFFEFVFR